MLILNALNKVINMSIEHKNQVLLARVAELELQVFQMDNSITSHHWENVRLKHELDRLTRAYLSELDELAQRNYDLRFELAALQDKA